MKIQPEQTKSLEDNESSHYRALMPWRNNIQHDRKFGRLCHHGILVEVLSTDWILFLPGIPTHSKICRSLSSTCLKLPSLGITLQEMHTSPTKLCGMLPPERSDHQSCLTHGARSLRNETSHLVVVPKMMKPQKNMGTIYNSFYNILDTFPIAHAVSIEQVSGMKRFSQIIWVNLRLRLFAIKVLKKSHCISISSAKSRWFRPFYYSNVKHM